MFRYISVFCGPTALICFIWANQSVAQPPTVIDDDVVHIEFDHNQGEIDALTYKYGSNQDIIDQVWVSGLGRLQALGEPGESETGSTVFDYEVQSNYAYFAYENPMYGEKSLDISWSQSGGIEVIITFEFDGPDDNRNEEGKWEPGGNNDGNDYITILRSDETEETLHYEYPGGYRTIWDGYAYGQKMWDEDYDERFGYRSECYMYTRVAEGASCDGPIHYMEEAGAYVLHFAVKNSAEFGAWFDSFQNTGQECSGEISSQFIRGDSEADMDVEMADAIEILKYLYIPGHPDLSCLDAADANDSGGVDASDSIYLLRYLYVPGEPAPPAPFPGCGDDPTDDGLGCRSHPCDERR